MAEGMMGWADRMKKKGKKMVDEYVGAAKDLAGTPKKLEGLQPYGGGGSLAKTRKALEAARKK